MEKRKNKYWEMILDEVVNKKAVRYFTHTSENKIKPNYRDLTTKFNRKRKWKMYRLGEKFEDIYFTKREAECMVQLLRGKSVRAAAETLKLSPRTVEFYLKNMKKKLKCRTKYELIDLVLGSEFVNNVDFLD